MPQPVAPPSTLGDDQLAAVYQLKIHLVGISPQIIRHVLVRVDTTLAELHRVFQVAMGWDNWHTCTVLSSGARSTGFRMPAASTLPTMPGRSTWTIPWPRTRPTFSWRRNAAS
ncbi:IS1096 element passenger TnpR family protein [Hymenobacter lapidarius]|uniref:IS1096 element passenger TnpR family protein n=1 Tax=Hymenobacter lapidarius TaxID=1908237 RepID=UPI00195A8B7F